MHGMGCTFHLILTALPLLAMRLDTQLNSQPIHSQRNQPDTQLGEPADLLDVALTLLIRCRGKCPTSFPNPNGQGAMWNRTLWREMAHVTAVELRAFWRADVGENHVDDTPHAGLDCWSPK